MLKAARTFGLILSLAIPATANALIVMDVEVVCPIGGERFETQAAMSGSQFGQNLDRRPLGAIASPWPLSKCPGNGFVIYRDEFSSAELSKLTAFVKSDVYQQLQKEETTYYLAAILMRLLDEPRGVVADALLKATWQVEADGRYTDYATEALAAFEDLIGQPDGEFTSAELHSYQQIAGELERRLGRFPEALKRFRALSDLPGVAGSDLERLVLQEIALIEAGDSSTHAIEQTDELAR